MGARFRRSLRRRRPVSPARPPCLAGLSYQSHAPAAGGCLRPTAVSANVLIHGVATARTAIRVQFVRHCAAMVGTAIQLYDCALYCTCRSTTRSYPYGRTVPVAVHVLQTVIVINILYSNKLQCKQASRPAAPPGSGAATEREFVLLHVRNKQASAPGARGIRCCPHRRSILSAALLSERKLIVLCMGGGCRRPSSGPAAGATRHGRVPCRAPSRKKIVRSLPPSPRVSARLTAASVASPRWVSRGCYRGGEVEKVTMVVVLTPRWHAKVPHQSSCAEYATATTRSRTLTCCLAGTSGTKTA